MKCGCSMQYPACARGSDLFATLVQSQRLLQTAPIGNREKEWKNYTDAYHAYRNHRDGCREGDIKVWGGDGTWRLELRWNAQWILRYTASEEHGLRSWLKERGFWRYAQIDEGLPQDRVTGYYHQRVLPAQSRDDTAHMPTSPPRQHALDVVSASEIDVKTKIALFIALLVAHFSRPLTLLDRLQIQRRVLNQFFSHGLVQIESSPGAEIVACIDEIIGVCQMLEQLSAATEDQQEQTAS